MRSGSLWSWYHDSWYDWYFFWEANLWWIERMVIHQRLVMACNYFIHLVPKPGVFMHVLVQEFWITKLISQVTKFHPKYVQCLTSESPMLHKNLWGTLKESWILGICCYTDFLDGYALDYVILLKREFPPACKTVRAGRYFQPICVLRKTCCH